MPLAGVSIVVVQAIGSFIAALIGGLGSMVGALAVLSKMMPERASIIIGYQGEVIDDLANENKRQAQLIADLEQRVEKLEHEPPGHLG